jgi:phosphonate transport system substrate-binding protein
MHVSVKKPVFSMVLVVLAGLAGLLLFSCNRPRPEVVEVDLSGHRGDAPGSEQQNAAPVLRVAIAPVISPRESFIYYQELFDYMGSHLDGIDIEFRQRCSYEEVNGMLERNEVDLAFICTGAYLEGTGGMDLLVGPLIRGRPYYQALVIVPAQSEATRFEDLQGGKFAYTDPYSFTGRLYPDYRARLLGQDPEGYFGSVQFTNGHDVSIQLVSRNLVDGASVSGLIFNYLQATNPEKTRNVRILERSADFGVPPIVTSLLLDQELRDQLRDLFLGLHLNPQGRDILDKLMIDRFVLVEDSLYQSARAIMNEPWL